MAKSEKQKQKLLVLRDYFLRRTDEAHPASMSDLLDVLSNQGIRAERKSIYSDLETLRACGMDIEKAAGCHSGYYLASRDFELPELKLLVDAVQSSRFLSERKSRELIRKLENLLSVHEAGALRRQVVVSGRVKTMNESIYYNVDRIHEAIAGNSQIRFRYFDWGVDGKRHFREGRYLASPIALCWAEENYYLIAHSERHGLTHYRVDKMESIEATGQPRVQTEETKHLDLAAYGKKVFGMYHGSETTVKLRFHNSLAGVVIDRFGHDSLLIPDGPEHVIFTAVVADSPLFLGWVAGFGNRAQILFPPQVVDEYRALLTASLRQYESENS
ncbi:MAG: WYL domain-containing protein [Oscillospiraceae bacterium]|nr:WYL domain-containing protein [Oscillospiraceae bacterium]